MGKAFTVFLNHIGALIRRQSERAARTFIVTSHAVAAELAPRAAISAAHQENPHRPTTPVDSRLPSAAVNHSSRPSTAKRFAADRAPATPPNNRSTLAGVSCRA
jgi:hypothetical protein